MTSRRFRKNLLVVIGIYCAACALGVGLAAFCPSRYSVFKDLVPLIVAIPAAWLAYCFQRRQAFLKDVHELWIALVNAFEDAVHASRGANSD